MIDQSISRQRHLSGFGKPYIGIEYHWYKGPWPTTKQRKKSPNEL
jgi:hypothetical protein